MTTTYTELLKDREIDRNREAEFLKTLPKPKSAGSWEWRHLDGGTASLVRIHKLDRQPFALMQMSPTPTSIGIAVDGRYVWLDENFDDITAAAERICELADQRVEQEAV